MKKPKQPLKTHIPMGGAGLLCGEDSWTAQVNSADNLCSKCLNRVNQLLSTMTLGQLRAWGLVRTEDPLGTWNLSRKKEDQE